MIACFAGVLRVIDASKGDTVVIYLPMVPEATIGDPNILPDISQAALNFQVQHSIGENVAWENHTHTSVLKTGQ